MEGTWRVRRKGRIDTLQNPTDRNKTVRHAIITGECGAQGHFAKNSRMKLPRKWLQLFAVGALLRELHIPNRKIDKNFKFDLEKMKDEVEYDVVNKIIDEKREASIEYLRQVIKEN